MGLYDRDYTQADFRSRSDGVPQMRLAFPQLTPVVKWLLIINVLVYLMQVLGADTTLTMWFSVFPASLGMTLQLWRYVTYQFLHGAMLHILFNMLGLYFLGPTLERHWGSKRFLLFYLGCGVAGGLAYPLLVAVKFLRVVPMIGASGAILGMLAACAILFPHFIVFIFFFPVPIRVAAVICILIASLTILSRGPNAGGEAAHLGGMIAGAAYVFSGSWRYKLRQKISADRWQSKITTDRSLELEVDRILQKVHEHGIASLTRGEKKTLRRASNTR